MQPKWVLLQLCQKGDSGTHYYLSLTPCTFWKFWISETSLGHLPRLLIMSFQSQFDFLYLGWMPWQGRVAETISEKILYFILIFFTFLLSDVACHILIFSFRHYFAMHFLFRQSSLLHGGEGDLPFLKLIHEVNSTSFLQTVNNTIQQYFILGGFHNSRLFRYLCFVLCFPPYCMECGK